MFAPTLTNEHTTTASHDAEQTRRRAGARAGAESGTAGIFQRDAPPSTAGRGVDRPKDRRSPHGSPKLEERGPRARTELPRPRRLSAKTATRRKCKTCETCSIRGSIGAGRLRDNAGAVARYDRSGLLSRQQRQGVCAGLQFRCCCCRYEERARTRGALARELPCGMRVALLPGSLRAVQDCVALMCGQHVSAPAFAKHSEWLAIESREMAKGRRRGFLRERAKQGQPKAADVCGARLAIEFDGKSKVVRVAKENGGRGTGMLGGKLVNAGAPFFIFRGFWGPIQMSDTSGTNLGHTLRNDKRQPPEALPLSRRQRVRKTYNQGAENLHAGDAQTLRTDGERRGARLLQESGEVFGFVLVHLRHRAAATALPAPAQSQPVQAGRAATPRRSKYPDTSRRRS